MRWPLRVLIGLLVVAISAGITTFLLERFDSRYEQAVLALQSLLAQRDKIFKPEVPVGAVGLASLQRAGVIVPPVFVKDDQLTTAWGGRLQLFKSETTLIVDFYDTPTRGCRAIWMNAEKYPGIMRIAHSSKAADERPLPVSEADIAAYCSETAAVVRIIAKP